VDIGDQGMPDGTLDGAAYDLIGDGWTVAPSRDEPAVPAGWESRADSYRGLAEDAVRRYSSSLTELQGAQNPAHRRNAESRFHLAVGSAVDLFNTVHQGRRAAFSPTGGGYSDFNNFLWQRGKRDGWINALREIHNYHQQVEGDYASQTYGLRLPDTDTLVARAALWYQ
jgi:hypothetical protein